MTKQIIITKLMHGGELSKGLWVNAPLNILLCIIIPKRQDRSAEVSGNWSNFAPTNQKNIAT